MQVSVKVEEWYRLLKIGPDHLDIAEVVEVGQSWVDHTRSSVLPAAEGPDFFKGQ